MCSLWIVYYKHKSIIPINFVIISRFWFILNKIPFKWYKVPTMLLEKVSIYTQKLYLFIVTRFYYYHLFFFCVCWKLYMTAKKYKWVKYCRNIASVCIFFSYKNVASKSFYKCKNTFVPLMLMQRNEIWYTYTPLGI